MAAKILLAPVAAGKTEYILNTTLEILQRRPLKEIWVLLATKRQEQDFRQRLVEWNSGRQVFFRVEFFNFYELYQRLLDVAGKPQRRLHDSARYALLRQIIQNNFDQLRVYHSIAHTPGFIRIMADFIYELKQNRIYPEDFRQIAQTDKDHDIARIYSAYQETLQAYNLVDKEGEGWLAVEVLRRDNTLADNLAALLVDGFDQFTTVQADLLTLLTDRAETSIITLTEVAGREATIGRRFRQAYELLADRLFPLITERVPETPLHRHADIDHLIGNIFRLNAAKRESSGGLTLIEAPDKADEVGAVMRRVKRLLLNGTSPDQILIALRDWGGYQGHFSRFGRKYGLPLALHYGEPLTENPVVIALINLLRLHESDFRRRDLLDALRSPYFEVAGFRAEAVDTLDRVSRVLTVTGGRELWLEALQQAAKPRSLAEDAEDDTVLVDAATAQVLMARLVTFFDAVTPPPQATLPQYVAWLETLIGADTYHNPDEGRFSDDDDNAPDAASPLEKPYTLNIVARLRDQSTPDDLISRDLTAMQEFKVVLRHLLSAHELLRSLERSASPMIPWATFFGDLVQTVENTAINPRPNRNGRVLVTAVTDARGLPHDHVFVLGLSEGIFPTPIPEDPLYLDSERRALTERRIQGEQRIQLATQSERAADDGLFYELICLPRQSLTLSRPTMQEGKLWLPSPLWQAVTEVFSDADTLIQQERIQLDRVLRVEEIATRDEAVITVVDALLRAKPEIWPAYHWLWQAESAYAAHIRGVHTIEADRISGDHLNHYAGRLEDAALLEILTRKLSPARVWSASQLTEYGTCGFRFFAGRLLRLEPLQEPEEGMDVLQRGTLHHDILEKTYRELRNRHLDIQPEHVETALMILEQVAAEVLATAPEKLGFRADTLWEYEKAIILRKLQQFVRVDFDPENPLTKKFKGGFRVPYILEAAFGYEGETVTIDLGAEVGEIRIRGRIDRIDRQSDGLIVIDYKTGSTGIPVTEMKAGRNFQMMVYLEGARAVLAKNSGADSPNAIIGGAFWHIASSDKRVSGDITLDDEGQSAIDEAKNHLANHIWRGRKGDFAVHASRPENGRCVRYCDFAKLCRMSSTNRRKQ